MSPNSCSLTLTFLFLCFSMSQSENEETFGAPRVLSRELMKKTNALDFRTPIYGMSRTDIYPLYKHDISQRAKKNFLRSPELLLALSCCLYYLFWCLAATVVTCCFANSYRCVLNLNHGNLCKTFLHYWCCCFVYHFCCKGWWKRKNKSKKSACVEDACSQLDVKEEHCESYKMTTEACCPI